VTKPSDLGARILVELKSAGPGTVEDLIVALALPNTGLQATNLSRILSGLQKKGLVEGQFESQQAGRKKVWSLVDVEGA
jgi:predicted ArsR family transcriptional regulator